MQRAAWLDLHEVIHWSISSTSTYLMHTGIPNNNFDIDVNDLNLMNDTSKRQLTLLLIFLVNCFNKQPLFQNH